MPFQHYEPVPQFEDTSNPHPLNRSYFSGLPSTAPPSFHSVALDLPHRHDESAATIIPPSERQRMGALSEMDGEAVSLWGTSEVGTEGGLRELEPAVVRLTERLERLEERSEAPAKVETDTEAQWREYSSRPWSKADIIGTVIALFFGLWICGIVTLSIMASYRRAGAKGSSG